MGARCPAFLFHCTVPVAVAAVLALLDEPLDIEDARPGALPTDSDKDAVSETVAVLAVGMVAAGSVSFSPAVVVAVALGDCEYTGGGSRFVKSRVASEISMTSKDVYAPTPKHVSTLLSAINTLQFCSP